jgi:hypothetical protein
VGGTFDIPQTALVATLDTYDFIIGVLHISTTYNGEKIQNGCRYFFFNIDIFQYIQKNPKVQI